MSTAINYIELIKSMDEYIQKLKQLRKENPEKARYQAMKSLKQSECRGDCGWCTPDLYRICKELEEKDRKK